MDELGLAQPGVGVVNGDACLSGMWNELELDDGRCELDDWNVSEDGHDPRLAEGDEVGRQSVGALE